MSKRRAMAGCAGVVLFVLLAGCAGGGNATGASDPGGAGSPGPLTTTPGVQVTPTPPDQLPPGNPPISPGKNSNEVTMTGEVVFVEIEGGCLTLRVNNKGYELMGGDRSKLTDGSRVTVRGVIRNDIATTCQVGPVLQVIEVRPA